MSQIEVQSKEVKSPDPKTVENRQYLEALIRYYLLRHIGSDGLPRDENGVLQVLSVACGLGYEAGAVIDLFRDSHYKGIDLDGRVIDLARKDKNGDLPSDKVEFAREDASVITEEERNKYGLTIIRNPQIISSLMPGGSTKEDWRKIIGASIDKTVENGWLFITVENAEYGDMVVKYLYAKKVMPVYSWPNELPSKAPRSLDFRDPMIIIGHK